MKGFVMRLLLTCFLTTSIVTASFRSAQAEEKPTSILVFCCTSQNDLYQILSSSEDRCPRFETAMEAVENAPERAGVLVLADGYPDQTTGVDPALLDKARTKQLRLYIEYPSSLSGLNTEEPRETEWERAVVSSDIFGPSLKNHTILAIHDCQFVPIQPVNSHIVLARVAGFDKAVYGIPDEAFPVLFEHADGKVLVATTKLSGFVSGRYAPKEAWRDIWRMILSWLLQGESVPDISWTPSVRPMSERNVVLPEGFETRAFHDGVDWFVRSGLLDHIPSKTIFAEPKEFKIDSKKPGGYGILEGYSSRIHYDGRQDKQGSLRSDCNGESAMALAFGGKIRQNADYQQIAENILNFWYFDSIAQKGVRADPDHPAFGLVAWGITSPAWQIAFYGDDNARLLLGTMAAAALLNNDSWNEAILKCLLGNLRTTGTLGFRRNRIDLPDLTKNGWRHYFDGSTTSYAPHYQAYLWACYLWAYRQTGYSLFLEKAENAIRMTMEAYPEEWHWTNGIAQERARMLLPLAWLVRVKDTSEHQRWLHDMTAELLKTQSPCGAIREELGKPGQGDYGPPQSNEEFGKDEATLLQKNGDPVCDLLYTTNFAFLGLHEAAAATGDRFYADAENILAEFLCRIQIHSGQFPELHGGWYRAFDFERWDYWGSSADVGWGPWSIETGWTQAWIASVLGMRQMNTSLWELTAGSNIGEHFSELRPLFIPD
ncbi:MAG: hypothetical protein ABIH23_26130 [bacterium]